MNLVKEGVLESDGLSFRYAEAGEGDAVVVFPADAGKLFDDVAEALASRHRVIALDAPSDAGKAEDLAKQLSQALARLDVTSFSVIGVSRGAAPALAQAMYTPQQVQRLVLLAPPSAAVQRSELEAGLSVITAPTLVLVGTRDRSGARDAGHICRERIPSCHLVLVYDAGSALVADRREACLSPINEFLEQGEGFIVFHASHVVHP